MANIINNLVNRRFGRLVVTGDSGIRTKSRGVVWSCVCDCGATALVSGNNFRRTRSCGCLLREHAASLDRSHLTTHGMSRSPTWRSWIAMRQRCYDKKQKCWKYYGGRGITVCDRWRFSFANFFADMGERPPGASIDRIDNDGNYEPGNCRWATQKQQIANQRKKDRVIL